MKKFIGIIAIIALVTVSAFADPLTSSDTLDVTLQVTGLLEAHWTAASMSDSTYDTEIADISTLSLGTITGGSGTVTGSAYATYKANVALASATVTCADVANDNITVTIGDSATAGNTSVSFGSSDSLASTAGRIVSKRIYIKAVASGASATTSETTVATLTFTVTAS